ncbi:NADH:ubiquinone oxidoreductase [Methanosarcinales archaeon]|nr:MAG: NADH:ubiquinone oxidoreductase [Methanosarcinales archaeon]RLG27507.1 MAG: NADH:ubiquinone oxidoreductase [Methanosarcinales archaeon]HHI30098.1 NADH:ubiquinone oxidoreductase [Candidatus Methanoperedenaceae archaeon]
MKLTVSYPPHIRDGTTIETVTWNKIVMVAIVALISIYVFGLPALALIVVSVLFAALTELCIQKLANQELTLKDGDAILIGLLIALLLPPTAPVWAPALGAVFAVGLVKHAFGGLGTTMFNPAITAWVFMNISWERLTASGSVPYIGEYSDLLLELGAGRLAEVSPIIFIIGGLYLVYKKYIDWRIPFSYLIVAIALALLLGEEMSYVVTGMLFLGAFIFANDTATSPITKRGRLVYGALCGVLTVVYGYFTYNYVVAVLYTIFFLNAVSAFIEKHTVPKPVDEVVA